MHKNKEQTFCQGNSIILSFQIFPIKNTKSHLLVEVIAKKVFMVINKSFINDDGVKNAICFARSIGNISMYLHLELLPSKTF